MLKIENISKTFKGRQGSTKQALKGVSLEVKTGSFMSIFGPNGCGKSTLLNIISGILEPDDGSLSMPRNMNRIGYVWQSIQNSLFPWLSVRDNIALPCTIEKGNEEGGDATAKDALEVLGFNLPLDSFPYALSGGQQQMVALARAVAWRPTLLLLDEPASALGHEARAIMVTGLEKFCKDNNITVLQITHDLDQAILMGDEIAVMSPGPGSIMNKFIIDLPRPRTHKMITSQSFTGTRNKVLSALERLF